LHRRPGQHRADELQLRGTRRAVLTGDIEDGAVELGYTPEAVGHLLGAGQVAILVEDGGELGHGGVEPQASQTGLGPAPALVRPPGKGFADEPRPCLLDEAQELVSELSVAFRKERLGRRGQAVPATRAAPSRPLVAVGHKSLVLEGGELLAYGRHGQAQLGGQTLGRRLPAGLEGAQQARPGTAHGPQGHRLAGAFGRRQLDRLRRAGGSRSSGGRGHGRTRWLSPNSCHR
jgi:hypothetical protein